MLKWTCSMVFVRKRKKIFHSFPSFLPHALWTVKHPSTGSGREFTRVWVFALCAIIIFLYMPCRVHIFHLFSGLNFPFSHYERKFHVRHFPHMRNESEFPENVVVKRDWNVSAHQELDRNILLPSVLCMLWNIFFCMSAICVRGKLRNFDFNIIQEDKFGLKFIERFWRHKI